jgi:hypothetical protein
LGYEGARNERDNDKQQLLSPAVPSICTCGLFIRIVTCGNYNICNIPIHLP